MSNYVWVVLTIYLSFALLELWRSNLFHKPGQTTDDGVVEVVSTVLLQFAIQPAIIVLVNLALGTFQPGARDALAGLSLLAGLALFLILDDMMQYWWHRASHNFAWLYNLHRAHHNGRYMSVRLVYRNNLFYYAMMPGIWLSAVLIYLGLGWIYAGYIVVKQLVIIASHSDVAWDRPLYRIKALSGLMWLVERTISTPATHHAHHGRHKDDPATYYKGNYGNLLFFWDVLFGTARITRSYPQSFGVENLPPASIGQMLLWPLVPEKQIR
jgi:sterol desaturase/sphingolipid hydroxylase (fatty acid hydroxylase superfamily)